jgi:hypothetical protein
MQDTNSYFSLHVRCWMCKHWVPTKNWIDRMDRTEREGVCNVFSKLKNTVFNTTALQYCPAGELDEKGRKQESFVKPEIDKSPKK